MVLENAVNTQLFENCSPHCYCTSAWHTQLYCKNLNSLCVHCVFQDRSFLVFHPLFWLTTYSPSLGKASCSNPHPSFSNCIQSDVTLVRRCLTTFRKKTIVYYLHSSPVQIDNNSTFTSFVLQFTSINCTSIAQLFGKQKDL